MPRKCIKFGRTKSRRVCRKFSGSKKTSSTAKKAASKTGGKKVCVRKAKVWSDIYQTDVSRCVKFSGGRKAVSKKKGSKKGRKSTGRKAVVSFMTKNGPVVFNAKV